MKNAPITRVVALASIVSGFLTGGALHAQTWTGNGTDNNWSTADNWSGGAVPTTSGAVIFGDTDKTDSSTPNSIVSASMTIGSLTFSNTGTTANDWQYVDIASGQKLTITSGFTANAAAAVTSNVKIGGAGSLSVAGTNFYIRNTTAGSTTNVDFSGLSSFTSNTTNFYVGTTVVNNQAATLSTLTLGSNNTITATTFSVGTSTKASTFLNQNTVLNLGASNTINAGNITVGGLATRQGATVRFADASGTPTTGGTVTIRGASGGSSRADLTIGVGGDGTVGFVNTVDFSGNTVDALLGNMIVGALNAGAGGTNTNNFSMNAGVVDATSVVVGKNTATAGTTTVVGNMNVSGGSFQAGSMLLASHAGTAANTATGNLNVSGTGVVQVGTSGSPANLVMGQVTGTAASTANASVNVTGGTLILYGNIQEGSNAGTGNINSSLTLNGGTLDMKGHDIAVDVFNAQSGMLKNLAEFNSGANLVKSGTGTLNLDGANTYSGNTVVNAGTFNLVDNATMTFYIGANGVNNGISGSGALTLDGDFIFDLSGATANNGDSWLIANVTTQTFGATFSVQGFTESSNVWTFGGYSFSEATGVLSYAVIPEPSSLALMGIGGGVLLALRRRKF